MGKYIDKDALVTEINKRIIDAPISYIGHQRVWAYNDVKSILDTLEVKEADLENSMVCKVDWHDGFLLDYTQEQQDELLEKIGANVGDKIRVILIKE